MTKVNMDEGLVNLVSKHA